MNGTIGIYKITNTTNGDFYIGSSVNIPKRKRKHKYELNNNIHANIHLQRAWNKYGGTRVFTFETILECTKEDILIQEQYYMDNLRPQYNICPTAGNSLGRIVTEDTRLKMSLAQSNRVYGESFSSIMRGVAIKRDNKSLDKARQVFISNNSIPVIKCCTITKKELREYSSINEAARDNNCSASNILKVCQGKPVKKSATRYSIPKEIAGFSWKFKNSLQ